MTAYMLTSHIHIYVYYVESPKLLRNSLSKTIILQKQFRDLKNELNENQTRFMVQKIFT